MSILHVLKDAIFTKMTVKEHPNVHSLYTMEVFLNVITGRMFFFTYYIVAKTGTSCATFVGEIFLRKITNYFYCY